MLTIELRTNIGALRQKLSDLQKIELPYAASRAATDVAFMVRKGWQDEMRRVFRNPTDWTLNGIVVDKADKSGRPSRVRFEESSDGGTPSGRYLRPQIEGGPRPHTPFENRLIRSGLLTAGEFLVPGKYAERDSAGNLVAGQVTKILSDLGTLETAQRGPNFRDRGQRSAESYRLERPTSGAPKGIYLQQGGRKLLVFLIVRQPQYNAILDLDAVSQRVLAREYAPAFRRNLDQAVRSSRYNPANLARSRLMHLRQQLRHAIATALQGLPTTGANVFPGREWPTDAADYPGLLIYARGGRSGFDAMAGSDATVTLERDETVLVEGIVRKGGDDRGAVSIDDLLDAIAAEVEPVMMASTAIGALVDRRELVATEIDASPGGETRRGSIKLTYRVVYATPAGDPTAKV
jgi:hypothetical protein